ncbi:MAG TPA: PEGA domain-containing protein [Methanoregulaceae archaeon]|nr:PEGA domain-containing protein [Methanoregulaceae archaeon]HPX73048.1 PEGA domain-containing protein [Methanoregulaceae archaeon]
MIVLLAVVCSPGLAITKSEIFPQYQRGFPLSPIPIPSATTSLTGSLLVFSDPSGSAVYLDDVSKGITPVNIMGISPGYHKLTVTRSKHQDYSISVLIYAGRTVTVYAVLESGHPVKIFDKIAVDDSSTPNPPGWRTLNSQFGIGSPLSDTSFEESYTSLIERTKSHPPYDRTDYLEIDTSVEKPSIYLYSDHDLTAQVRLMPESAITVSDPVYQPGMGWQAAIWNGSLNGKGDFLFYEGMVPDSGWQKREGYVIRATYRGQDMAFMLGQYGFNEKETAEFIDYWVSPLPGDVDYVFYPQETGAVEQVMPLIISPEPDDVMRIWFCAEPLISAPAQVTSPEKIVREGFYVVEWGVMVKDK